MPKFKLSVLALALISGILPAQTPAQKKAARPMPASAYKLIRIKISGSTRYTPEQILAFSGLHIGDNVGDDNFKEVAGRLGETGLFTNVAYSFTFSPSGTEVEFHLADNDKLVPAAFENLVWFSDDELRERLRASVPLFQGELPLSGSLIDTVADSLQAFLALRGVESAKVEISRPGGDEGTINSVVYSVSGPTIRIRKLEFPGAKEAELPQLLNAAKREQGDEYQRSKLRMFSRIDLAPIYLREGKLRVKFGNSEAKVVQETPQDVLVDATIPVEEGGVYKLAALEWSGNKLMPVKKLAPLIHQQPGQVVDAVQLQADLDKVNLIYRTLGYINAKVYPRLELDDAAGTASYKLEVKEGDQYKMGEVDIEGLDEKAKVRARDAWALREGEPYDGSYAKNFLQSAKGALPNLNLRMTVHESVNESDKTVDVTLQFTVDSLP